MDQYISRLLDVPTGSVWGSPAVLPRRSPSRPPERQELPSCCEAEEHGNERDHHAQSNMPQEDRSADVDHQGTHWKRAATAGLNVSGDDVPQGTSGRTPPGPHTRSVAQAKSSRQESAGARKKLPREAFA